ncbi:hypothetical protein [Paenibacillus albidus]|uniref:hypothetical protein n=1 Tax=Paenibacillus albidus TaxID=2041023 RepID=UPI001668B3CA|nr:hypothetical protein [Paenibacillus albidus]
MYILNLPADSFWAKGRLVLFRRQAAFYPLPAACPQKKSLHKRGIIIFLMLAPLLMLSQESQAVLVTYGLVAMLSSLYYRLLNTNISRIADLKEDIENKT